MPLPIPTRRGVVDSVRNYVRGELPDIDPSTERRSYIGGLVKGFGSTVADWYIALKRFGDREPFPQTATGKFLTRGWWKDLTKLDILPAAPAHGYLAVVGSGGATVLAGTQVQGSGTTYTVLDDVSIVAHPFACVSLTADADTGLATYITPNPHFLATGLTASIQGATQTDYNGSFQITVIADDAFTYELSAIPAGAATGSPMATVTYAPVLIEATTTGQGTNADSGSTLTLSGTAAGVDSTGFVTFGGISGGADVETPDSFRARVLAALGTDYGSFTQDEIIIVAEQVPGVTKAFVRRAKINPPPGWPLEGQVKVAFLRENDADPIPSSQEVADVKARIIELTMPANTAEEDVIVISMPKFVCNYAFTSITPDTPGMRKAIRASLAQFHKEGVTWGGVISVDEYRCAIKAAFDVSTRQRLKSFTLSYPTTDLTPGVDDYPVLGTVNFAG